jgi:hypothetical protein
MNSVHLDKTIFPTIRFETGRVGQNFHVIYPKKMQDCREPVV